MNRTDLIIIGAGPGGYVAAEQAAKQGLTVTIFESGHVGGTCLNYGCIPTKTYCHETDNNHKSIADVWERKEQVVGILRDGVEQLLSHPNVTLIYGCASFKDAATILCNGEEYTAPNIMIATGSIAKRPSIDGIDLPHVVTSTELLETTTMPQHLAIIGAGVIGMEFASIFHRMGSQVSVIEYLKECLPAMDGDISKRLRKNMEKQGVDFYMQASVKRITPNEVIFERKGKETVLSADLVLIATGRKPNIEKLNLEAANINYSHQGITVNPDTFKVVTADNKPAPANIYAIGDVNGLSLLAHAASMQGIHVVNQIVQRQDNIRFDIMPAAVFTTPEVASVGMTEEQCKTNNTEYVCHKAFYRANGRALAMNKEEGILKLITDPNGHIVGCHVMGSHAADIVQETTALMNFNATIDQLRDIIHIHPTLSEILHAAAL